MSALIQSCPTCGGSGTVRDQRQAWSACPTCRGAGTAVWLGGQWWAWRHPLNDLSILERRVERILRTLVNITLAVFCVGSLFVGGTIILQAVDWANVPSELVTQGPGPTIWWLGVLFGLYLIYRLVRARDLRPMIPLTLAEVPPPATTPWGAPKDLRDFSPLFASAAMTIIERAWQLAFQHRGENVTPLHILDILRLHPAVASMIVRIGSHPERIHDAIQKHHAAQPATQGTPELSTGTHALFAHALRIAAEDRHLTVTPSSLFAAIAAIDDAVRDILDAAGIDPKTLQAGVAWLRVQEHLATKASEYAIRAARKPKGKIDRAYTARATPLLDRIGMDLTRLARDGRLPYIVGREDAVATILRVMSSARRSVMIVGDTGVGKTTVLQALAERMSAEDVPEQLQDKRLVAISAGDLVSGALSADVIETRVQLLIGEVSAAGNIILAIDHFDQLVGLSSSGGALDAANLFLQAMNDGAFLGVVTANRDAARTFLDRGIVAGSLERIDLQEMSAAEALIAVESRIGALEYRHHVFFTYQAIAQAVELSHRYLHEQTLPGKALELLSEAAATATQAKGKNSLVTGDDVAQIVTQRTHTPVSAAQSDERERLLHLEERMHQRIIGQSEAVTAVANALRRARAELRDAKRPIATFLFVGPTGVGKTELAKTLAEVYFGGEETMVRLDMSEYQDASSVSRLIGAPPGYAGAGTGGTLTEAVRRKSFSLILLDELEKAHPDVWNIFLQVFDDGRLTDSTGRTIDFTNAIIVATSNAATGYIQDRLQQGTALETVKKELINGQLQQTFRPEFLNRFDNIILFTPLSMIEVQQIVRLMVAEIAKQLEVKNIHFTASPEAIAELAQAGYDPQFGARSLRRTVQEKVDNALATILLEGRLERRDTAVLEAGGAIRIAKPSA